MILESQSRKCDAALKSLRKGYERPLFEAVNVKPKLLHISQDLEDARVM